MDDKIVGLIEKLNKIKFSILKFERKSGIYYQIVHLFIECGFFYISKVFLLNMS